MINELSPDEKAFEEFAKRHSFYGHDKSVARRVWYAISGEKSDDLFSTLILRFDNLFSTLKGVTH